MPKGWSESNDYGDEGHEVLSMPDRSGNPLILLLQSLKETSDSIGSGGAIERGLEAARATDLEQCEQIGIRQSARMSRVLNEAVSIDDEGSRNSDDTEQILDSPGRSQGLPQNILSRVAVCNEIITRPFGRPIQTDQQQNHTAILMSIHHRMKVGKRLEAGVAPRRPEIDHHHAATQLRQRNDFTVQALQAEIGRHLGRLLLSRE